MRATSLDAFQSIIDSLSSMRRSCYDEIHKKGMLGSTAEEVEHSTGNARSTVSARVGELEKMNLVLDSGIRRDNLSGRSAIVWVSAAALKRCEPGLSGVKLSTSYRKTKNKKFVVKLPSVHRTHYGYNYMIPSEVITAIKEAGGDVI